MQVRNGPEKRVWEADGTAVVFRALSERLSKLAWMPMSNVVDADDGVKEEPSHHNRGEQPPQVVGAYPLEGVKKDQHCTRDAHHHTCASKKPKRFARPLYLRGLRDHYTSPCRVLYMTGNDESSGLDSMPLSMLSVVGHSQHDQRPSGELQRKKSAPLERWTL